MKTVIQSETSKGVEISLPFAAPLLALSSILLIAAGASVVMTM